MAKALVVDLYELTMAQVYFKYKKEVEASFDLFIRSDKRPFYLACGIDDVLDYLQSLKFTREDICYLKSLNFFEDEFLEYLKSFRFRGEVWGVDEPEIIFAQEPILRVSANLIEAQIIESALLNKINLATTLATKAARVVLAASDKKVYDFSLRRAQGIDASLATAKYSYIAGAKGTSNVYAGFVYKIPVSGTMAHSFVMSFDNEIDSFLAFAKTLPSKSILLVDTYNVKKGVATAIKTAKALKAKNIDILGIRLDSGDLTADSKYARKEFDKAGLRKIGIFASGDLDEYKIEKLIDEGAPINAFGVGTRMGCSADIPYSDTIYKLVEIREKSKEFKPVMKLSKNKASLPSKKQVFRKFNKKGIMIKDCIGLTKEKNSGKKLLTKIMAGGRRLYKTRSLDEKQKMFFKKSSSLPAGLKKAKCKYSYPVNIGPELDKLTRELKKQIKLKSSYNKD